MIRHFFLIRFSLGELDPSWLEHRIEIFNKITLPSLLAQVDKDFEVILCCHPSSYTYVDEYRMKYPFIKILYTEEPWFDSKSSTIVGSVTWRLSERDHIVITTRLDNDDAINVLFNKEVRSRAEGIKESSIIIFPNGFLLKNNRLYSHKYHKHHFLSLAEPTSGEIKTVFCGNHMRVPRKFPNISIEHMPGWIEYIHDRNMKNTLERRDKTDDSESVGLETRAKEFGLETSVY